MSPLFSWNARRGETSASSVAAPRIVETLSTSRTLPKFLAALAVHPAPVVLDLGPVVGANVAFFGDRLACKILIEDLYRDIEAYPRRGGDVTLADVLTTRVAESVSDPVHGVLCWDLFDYLDRPTARALARCLRQVMHPKAVLHGLFGTTAADLDYRTRFIVQSESTVKCRQEPAASTHRHALQIGEIARLFDGLTIVESVLLQSRARETLFRKG